MAFMLRPDPVGVHDPSGGAVGGGVLADSAGRTPPVVTFDRQPQCLQFEEPDLAEFGGAEPAVPEPEQQIRFVGAALLTGTSTRRPRPTES